MVNFILTYNDSVRSNSIRNIESARISIIGQLKKLTSTSNEVSQEHCTANISPSLLGSQSYQVMQTEITEEEEEVDEPRQKRETPTPASPTSPTSEFKLPNVKLKLFVIEDYYKNYMFLKIRKQLINLSGELI